MSDLEELDDTSEESIYCSRSLSAPRDEEEQEQIRLVESPDFLRMDHPNLQDDPPSPGGSYEQKIRIDRPVMSHTILYAASYNRRASANPMNNNRASFAAASRGFQSGLNDLVGSCGQCTPGAWLLSLIPILQWLPKYQWKKDLSFDLIAGFTVAVMHIPQGMAYAMLGNLPPIVGIYMAFYPVLIYSVLGTSRHVSMGTFAVICLMTGKVATEKLSYFAQMLPENNGTFSEGGGGDDDLVVMSQNQSQSSKADYDIVQIATALSFSVGLWQTAFGFFRLGSLSLLLSAELVSGFTTGAAVHVLTSQLKSLLGLSLPRRNGILKIPLTYMDIGMNIKSANVTAVILSGVTITTLVFYNEIVKPYVSQKIPFPIPIELITIIIGTLVSLYMRMQDTYGITIVNHVPTGLPGPTLPPMDILPDLLVDGLIICVVAYAISISMAKIFATKHNYNVDANQELIANGASNIVGSFFQCAPISASLSRSVIQDAIGGKTQLASIFSCSILVFVLLWIGPFFETLPNCVLSSIIVVALKGMFMQLADLPAAWRQSRVNGIIWFVTFVSTVILEIEYGLAIGLLLSLSSLIWRSNRPHVSILGAFAESDVYMDVESGRQTKEIHGIKIVKYTGSLNFATVEHFISKIFELVPSKSLEKTKRKGGGVFGQGVLVSTISKERIDENMMTDDTISTIQHGVKVDDMVVWIILDFSSVSSVDPAAVKALNSLCKHYGKEDIQMLFAGCPQPVITVMDTCQLLKNVGPHHFFPSIHDAVVYCSSATYLSHGPLQVFSQYQPHQLRNVQSPNGSNYRQFHNGQDDDDDDEDDDINNGELKSVKS